MAHFLKKMNQVPICPLENSLSTSNHASKSCQYLRQLYYGQINFTQYWFLDRYDKYLFFKTSKGSSKLPLQDHALV